MLYKSFKRIFDVLCAVTGIICTSPFWILAVIGILVSDPGPVFYISCRIGKDNRPFRMYKFRSMRMADVGDESSLRPAGSRIFPFGHFIRKVKIDELPQLINVLNGSMSLIGPRPVAEDQFGLFRYGKWDIAKTVPVGLSGPAALYDYIYGDRFTNPEEYFEKVYPTRRELEYVYVQKASLQYDCKMVVYTFICILYAIAGKECSWILAELKGDAEKTMNENIA